MRVDVDVDVASPVVLFLFILFENRVPKTIHYLIMSFHLKIPAGFGYTPISDTFLSHHGWFAPKPRPRCAAVVSRGTAAATGSTLCFWEVRPRRMGFLGDFDTKIGEFIEATNKKIYPLVMTNIAMV